MIEPVLRVFEGTGAQWDATIEAFYGAHFLQTDEWAQVKEAYGWQAERLIWLDERNQIVAAAQTLTRGLSAGSLPLHLNVIYIPKGPLLRSQDDLIHSAVIVRDLEDFARRKRALFLKIDPDIPTGKGITGAPDHVDVQVGLDLQALLTARGWRYSAEQVQFKNTVLIDLVKTEDDLLAAMKQKTRYNVRLAEKRGVQVRAANLEEVEQLYPMYLETAVRDGFVLRDKDYYLTVWKTFIRAGKCEILVAEVDGEPVAAAVILIFGGKAWYVYGMSREAHRDKMPNYLLQWEAMRRAKRAGCQVYDMWGAPDLFAESDPLWGVFRFKQGFNGEVINWAGAWDFPTHRQGYWAFTRFLPKILAYLRGRGLQRDRKMVST